MLWRQYTLQSAGQGLDVPRELSQTDQIFRQHCFVYDLYGLKNISTFIAVIVERTPWLSNNRYGVDNVARRLFEYRILLYRVVDSFSERLLWFWIVGRWQRSLNL